MHAFDRFEILTSKIFLTLSTILVHSANVIGQMKIRVCDIFVNIV